MNDIHPIVYDLIASVIVPLLVSFFKNVEWTPNQKLLLTFAVSFLAALASAWLNGSLTDINDVARSFAVIFTAATAIYRFILEHTDLNRSLEDMKVL